MILRQRWFWSECSLTSVAEGNVFSSEPLVSQHILHDRKINLFSICFESKYLKIKYYYFKGFIKAYEQWFLLNDDPAMTFRTF